MIEILDCPWANMQDSIHRQWKQKRAEGVAQVEKLFSKIEALISNPIIEKTKNNSVIFNYIDWAGGNYVKENKPGTKG
jgi:hypothetical protein